MVLEFILFVSKRLQVAAAAVLCLAAAQCAWEPAEHAPVAARVAVTR